MEKIPEANKDAPYLPWASGTMCTFGCGGELIITFVGVDKQTRKGMWRYRCPACDEEGSWYEFARGRFNLRNRY